MENKTVSFDALLTFALLEADAREERQRPSLKQLDKMYPASPAFEARVRTLLAAQERKRKFCVYRRVVKRTVACAVCVLAVVTCVFAPVQAVREAVVSTVIEWKEKFAEFSFRAEAQPAMADFSQTIAVLYWPEGYAPVQTVQTETMFWANAENGNGGTCSVEIRRIEKTTDVNMDNEYSQFNQISFGEREAVWTRHESGANVIVWVEDGSAYTVNTSESLNEAIAIAESIQVEK